MCTKKGLRETLVVGIADCNSFPKDAGGADHRASCGREDVAPNPALLARRMRFRAAHLARPRTVMDLWSVMVGVCCGTEAATELSMAIIIAILFQVLWTMSLQRGSAG